MRLWSVWVEPSHEPEQGAEHKAKAEPDRAHVLGPEYEPNPEPQQGTCLA